MRRVRETIATVEKAISITYSEGVRARVCSPSYVACTAHALYCHLWPLAAIIFVQGHGFRNKFTHSVHVDCIYNFYLKHFSF